MSSSTTYKLVYFNVRYIAEISRLLFKAAGQEFEDYRYPIEFKDGKKIRPEFDAVKSKYTYGQIPVLEIDGGKYSIAQSKAIERFLARRFNMFGSNDIEGALIDAAGEQLTDMKQVYTKAKSAGAESLQKFFDEDLKKTLAAFEKQANKENSGFWIGSTLSLFDVQFFNFVDSLDEQESIYKALEDFPSLKAIVDQVGNIPAIKKWIEERPKTQF